MKQALATLILLLTVALAAPRQDYRIDSYSLVYQCLVIDGGQIVRLPNGQYWCVFPEVEHKWTGPAERF